MTSTSRQRRDARGAKRYQPKVVALNAIERAINGVRKLSTEDQTAIKRDMDTALREFGCGRDCASHWLTMADSLNVAEQLAARGICSDAASQERIQAGQAALVTVNDRHATTGSWTLYAAERTALDDALWLHGVQVEHCSLSEYAAAVQAVRQRVQQAIAGNAPRGARVLLGDLGAAL